jgi:hypothetical protein
MKSYFIRVYQRDFFTEWLILGPLFHETIFNLKFDVWQNTFALATTLKTQMASNESFEVSWNFKGLGIEIRGKG